MRICAGTSQGVFTIARGEANRVLDSRGVRELVQIESRLFAGTGDGLYISDDQGGSWTLSGLEGREVWQIRDNGDGLVYAGTAPTGLFRSEDNGSSWTEIGALGRLADEQGWCVPVEPPVEARARALVRELAHGQPTRKGRPATGRAFFSDAIAGGAMRREPLFALRTASQLVH